MPRLQRLLPLKLRLRLQSKFPEQMLAVGRIVKLFGDRGEVNLALYDDFPDDFNWEEQPLFTKVDSMVVPLFFDSFARRGATGAVASIADIDTPYRAGMLTGKELYIETDDDEEEESFEPEDLIGFNVETDYGNGKVTDFYDSDVNPLFEITVDGKECLVPAVEEFVEHIDIDRHTIRMNLPEGLLDL